MVHSTRPSFVVASYLLINLDLAVAMQKHLNSFASERRQHSPTRAFTSASGGKRGVSSETTQSHDVVPISEEQEKVINETVKSASHAHEKRGFVNDRMFGAPHQVQLWSSVGPLYTMLSRSSIQSVVVGAEGEAFVMALAIVFAIFVFIFFLSVFLLVAAPAFRVGASRRTSLKPDQRPLLCSDLTLQGNLGEANLTTTELLCSGACNITSDGMIVLRARATDTGSTYTVFLELPRSSATIASVVVPKFSRSDPVEIKGVENRHFGYLKMIGLGRHVITYGEKELYSVVVDDSGSSYIMHEIGAEVFPVVNATRSMKALGPKIQTSHRSGTDVLINACGNVDMLAWRAVQGADAALALICILSLVLVDGHISSPTQTTLPSKVDTFSVGLEAASDAPQRLRVGSFLQA